MRKRHTHIIRTQTLSNGKQKINRVCSSFSVLASQVVAEAAYQFSSILYFVPWTSHSLQSLSTVYAVCSAFCCSLVQWWYCLIFWSCIQFELIVPVLEIKQTDKQRFAFHLKISNKRKEEGKQNLGNFFFLKSKITNTNWCVYLTKKRDTMNTYLRKIRIDRKFGCKRFRFSLELLGAHS